MKKKNNNNISLPTSFLDILFNLSLIFLSLLLLLIVIIKTETVKAKINAEAEYIITVSWPEGDWDIDVWVGPPSGDVVFYRNKTSPNLNLERDDTGVFNDKIEINGKEHYNPLNQEIVVFRGIVEGEYIVNIHLYRTGSQGTGYDNSPIVDVPIHSTVALIKPVDVTIKIDKINPSLKTIFVDKIIITHNRQEKHVVRFWINEDGSIGNIDTTNPVSLHSLTGEKIIMEMGPSLFQEKNNDPFDY